MDAAILRAGVEIARSGVGRIGDVAVFRSGGMPACLEPAGTALLMARVTVMRMPLKLMTEARASFTTAGSGWSMERTERGGRAPHGDVLALVASLSDGSSVRIQAQPCCMGMALPSDARGLKAISPGERSLT